MLAITNLTPGKIDKAFLKRVVQQMLKFLGKKKLDEISVVLITENKIKEINKKYRHKNQPTNVLSFEELNEIFLCPKIIKKEAQKQKISFKTELTRVLIHGILHLLGHEHEKSKKAAAAMQNLEQKLLKINF